MGLCQLASSTNSRGPQISSSLLYERAVNFSLSSVIFLIREFYIQLKPILNKSLCWPIREGQVPLFNRFMAPCFFVSYSLSQYITTHTHIHIYTLVCVHTCAYWLFFFFNGNSRPQGPCMFLLTFFTEAYHGADHKVNISWTFVQYGTTTRSTCMNWNW